MAKTIQDLKCFPSELLASNTSGEMGTAYCPRLLQARNLHLGMQSFVREPSAKGSNINTTRGASGNLLAPLPHEIFRPARLVAELHSNTFAFDILHTLLSEPVAPYELCFIPAMSSMAHNPNHLCPGRCCRSRTSCWQGLGKKEPAGSRI